MVKNYWLKQFFWGAIFVLCEIMIFLALLSSKHYLGLVMWALHPWPVMFMINLLRKKLSGDLSQVSDLFDKGLENLVDNVKNFAPGDLDNETRGPGSD